MGSVNTINSDPMKLKIFFVVLICLITDFASAQNFYIMGQIGKSDYDKLLNLLTTMNQKDKFNAVNLVYCSSRFSDYTVNFGSNQNWHTDFKFWFDKTSEESLSYDSPKYNAIIETFQKVEAANKRRKIIVFDNSGIYKEEGNGTVYNKWDDFIAT